MPIGSGIVYNTGDLILSQVSSSGTAFLETKIAAATSSLIYFDSTARINSASLNSITVGTASYVSGSTSIITNLTASNISASGTSSFGMVGIGTTVPGALLDVNGLFRFQQDIRVNNGTDKLILSATSTTTELHSAGTTGIVFKNAGNNEIVRFDAATGNVGIGTSSPGALLEISSSTAASLLNVKGAGGNGILFVSGSGNVGVGTPIPTARLDVRPATPIAAYQGTVPYQTTTAAILSPVMAAASTDTYTSILQLVSVRQALVAGRYAHGYLGFSTVDNSNISGILDAGRISIKNDEGIGLYSPTAMGFWTNPGGSASTAAIERVRIASDGNVGIGTTTASYKLTVQNDAASTNALLGLQNFSTSATTNHGVSILPILSDNTGSTAITAGGLYWLKEQQWTNDTTSRDSYLRIDTTENGSASEKVRIKSDGNVGIGTTSPVDKLHVIGNTTLVASDATSLGSGTKIRFYRVSDGWEPAQIEQIWTGTTLQGVLAFKTNTDTLGTLTTKMVINNNGNVGIGTTNPSSRLHISGSSSTTITITDDALYTNSISNDNSVMTYTVDTGNAAAASADHVFKRYTTELVRINASGNVGIGTSSPGTKLEVSGSIRGGFFPVLVTNTGEAWFGRGGDRTLGTYTLQLGGSSATGTKFEIVDRAWTKVIASISGEAPVDSFVINTSGNLGIGTGSPGAKLQVNGNVSGSSFTSSISNAVGFLGTASWAQNVVSASFATTAQTANALNASNTYTIAGLTSAYVDVNGSSAPTTGIYRPSTKTLGLSADGTLIFKISNVSAPATSSIETGNFLVQSGNVGIGITAPAYKLDVVGDIHASSEMYLDNGYYLRFKRSSGGVSIQTLGIPSGTDDVQLLTSGDFNILNGSLTNLMTVKNGGSVGIGITSPTVRLHVSGSSIITNPNPGANSAVLLVQDEGTATTVKDGTTLRVVNNGSAANFSVFEASSAASDFVILNNGNVGIGTTSPTGSLHIENTTSTIPILSLGGGVASLDSSDLYVLNSFNTGSGVGFAAKVIGINISGSLTEGNIPLQRTVWSGVSSATAIVLSADDPGSGTDDNAFQIWTSNQGTAGTALTQKFTLTSAGEVGIGTTDPIAKLQVAGNISGSSFTSSISNAVGFLGTSSWAQNVVSASFATTAQTANALNASNTYTIAGLTSAYVDVNGSGTIPTTGIYRPSTKTLGLSADGTLIFKISNVSAPATSSIETGNFVVQSGNFGIGTTSPPQKLSIAAGGNLSFQNTLGATGNYGAIYSYNDLVNTTTPATAIRFIRDISNIGPDGAIAFDTNNTERIRVTSANGYVGIGTTTPNNKLHVYNSAGSSTTASNAIAVFEQNSNAVIQVCVPDANASGLFFSRSGSAYYSGIERSGTDLFLKNNNTTAVTINSSGNVGIGTSVPGALLDVSYGDYQNAGTIRMGADLGTNTSRTNATRKWGLITGYNYTNASAAIPIIGYDSANTYTAINIGGGTSAIAASPTYISFYTTSSLSTYGTERVRIDSSGNVGIGTLTPSTKLAVEGGSVSTVNITGSDVRYSFDIRTLVGGAIGFNNAAASNVYGVVTGSAYFGVAQAFPIVFTTAGAERIRIEAGGNVGIGTTVPNAKFDVRPDSSWVGSEAVIIDTDGGNNPRIKLYRPDGASATSSYAIHLRNDSGNLNILNTGVNATLGSETVTSKFYINTVGNVGIGTTNPVAKLQVVGNISGSSFTSSVSNAVGFLGTSSWANNVVSASYATTAQTANALNTGNSYTIAGLTNNGTLSQQGTLSMGSGYQILATTGTTSNPGIAFVGDTNTGIYSSGADTIGLVTGGSEKVTINSTGNVGIGTNNPAFKLDVSGSGVNARIGNAEIGQWPAATAYTYFGHESLDHSVGGNYAMVQSSAGETFINSAAGQVMHFSVGNSEKVQISSAGNVGINTQGSVINAKLTISGSGSDALLHIKSPISGAILYVSGSGAVGIGTSNVGAFTLQVSGSFGATTKSFIIDHPTKAGKKLMYGSLESPYHGIRLTGRDTLVNGKCKIQLPDYMYKLILHDSVNIQLTGIKCNKTLYVDEINIPENYFTIAYDKAIFESYKDYDFFWDFTAIRADVPELNTEL